MVVLVEGSGELLKSTRVRSSEASDVFKRKYHKWSTAAGDTVFAHSPHTPH